MYVIKVSKLCSTESQDLKYTDEQGKQLHIRTQLSRQQTPPRYIFSSLTTERGQPSLPNS